MIIHVLFVSVEMSHEESCTPGSWPTPDISRYRNSNLLTYFIYLSSISTQPQPKMIFILSVLLLIGNESSKPFYPLWLLWVRG